MVRTPSVFSIIDVDTRTYWIFDDEESRGSSAEGVSGPDNTDIFDNEEGRRGLVDAVLRSARAIPFQP